MSQIILATINARYIHAAVGLRYLFANLGDLRSSASIMEFENGQRAKDIAEAILSANPEIVGFGVYIWNVVRTREVVSIIKKVRPEVRVVIGGPEVSFEYEDQPIVQLCDYLITGEADTAFAELCRVLLRGDRPAEKIINAPLPDLKALSLPYPLYSAEDIRNRVIYVEVSRGCPFTCEFCLSSIDIPVRQFDHTRVLEELRVLFERGARTFKFIDRTFNLNVRTSTAILQFFLDRMEPGLFVHFEMVPDRFPAQLREVVARFPPGALQLEIGIQTLNPNVSGLISRRQDVTKLVHNLRFLRNETYAHLHIDLIVGLPGEDIESFARGFNRLIELNPHEIQIGILKRLRGTPITRHTVEYQMRYSEEPPYEVMSTRDISFLELQRMERFARYFDLVANSGNFVRGRELIWKGEASPFHAFLRFSDWLFARIGRRASIQLKSLTAYLFDFLVTEKGLCPKGIGPSLLEDYQRGGRSDVPSELKPYGPRADLDHKATKMTLKRQQRFMSAD